MRILLVEDNLTDVLLVEDALADMTVAGQQLSHFAHADRLKMAEEILVNEEFDVILVDLGLPDGQGLENFERLQTLAPKTPVIVLTGLSDHDIALEAIQRGAADYLIKTEVPGPLLERSIRYAIERKRNENSRLELVKAQVAQAEAEAANKAKDQFLAMISHELRTPLNAIMGWASLLKTGDLEEEVQVQAIDVIERNARVQAQLIEDLLDVSRIIAGNFRLEYADFDLNGVVRAALEGLQIQIDAKKICLELDFADLPAMLGDPMRLQQVTWNLVANAVKFTPEEGTVRISTSCSDGSIRLEIKDNGQGIEPEFISHVFDRFRQADSSTARRHGGLGLGLAIALHIVELHGGQIIVESEGFGKGATFTVIMPVSFCPQN
jgi:signal transduction histidine kinase